MANKIRINTNTLKSDADSVKQSLDRMTKAMNTMNSLKGSLDSMWDGPASDKFKSAWGVDLQNLQSLISELTNDLYKYETNAQSKYESCDQKVQSIISSLKV